MPSTIADDILALAARGLTDEATARQVGVSVRTVRRFINDYMREVGAISRFQAGGIWAVQQMNLAQAGSGP